MTRDSLLPIHGCVTVDMDCSRMLHVSRLCASLPVFASDALRTSPTSSVRFHHGEWLVVVAGNELFLWKYTTSAQSQSHSPCIKFTLPASDMPHTANLVGLIYPTGSHHQPNPTGCLALTPTCDSLRLWPRLVHNSFHVDINLTSTLANLCCDEAVHLEPTAVPGVCLLATRTGHLLLLDTRNAQEHGAKCRLLRADNSGSSAGAPGTPGSLLSGLGRRVSNLFSMVSSSTALLQPKLGPARGGGSMQSFVRLITRSDGSSNGLCRVYMLLDSQLDVWTIDNALKEQLQNVYSIDALLSTSQTSLFGEWRAVDMAVQHAARGFLADDNLYVVVSNGTNCRVLTFGCSTSRSGGSILPQLSLDTCIDVEWPLPSNNEFGLAKISPQLCLPAKLSPDADSSPLYPCLLGCLYSVHSGQVLIFEVLTGQTVAKLNFRTEAHRGNLPEPSSLIGCGSVDSRNLFVFVTCQRGLVSLVPTTDVNTATTFNLLDSSDMDLSKTRASSTALDTTEHPRTRCDLTSVIVVDTFDKGRLRASIHVQNDVISVYDQSDSLHRPLSLQSEDQIFVVLSGVARVFWMGFPEQASKYLRSLVRDSNIQSFVPVSFLRLARRILNERPSSDARWRQIMSSFHTKEEDGILTPEGCASFQFIATSPSTEAPLLSSSRFSAKLDALGRLKGLWSLVCDSSNWNPNLSFIALDVVSHRLCRGPRSDLNSMEDEPSSDPRRCFAGEDVLYSRQSTDALNQFACTLADDEHEVDACASRLLRSLEADRILQSAEDVSESPAMVHVIAGLHMAEELVEFAKAVQVKFSQDSSSSIVQDILESTALDAGFSPTTLQVIRSKEAVFQTLTLVPNFIASLCDRLTEELPPSFPDDSSTALSRLQPKPTQCVQPTMLELLHTAAGFALSGLSAVASYRDRQLSGVYKAVGNFPGQAHYLPCGITDTRPYGIGDVLLQLFDHLVRFGCGELGVVNSDTAHDLDTHDISSRAVELATHLLNLARQRLRWATVHSRWALDSVDVSAKPMDRVCCVQRLRRIRYWFVHLREYLIDSIADRLHRPEAALHLAERFADCAQMVRLCYVLEEHDNLDYQESYLGVDDGLSQRPQHRRLLELIQRVPASYGLADCALQWYFARGEHSRVQSLLALLEQPPQSKPEETVVSSKLSEEPQVFSKPRTPVKPKVPKVDSVSRFLHREDARDLAWPHLLSTRQYAEAARMLFDEGCKEVRFLGRRKTLLSLAKLAILASDDQPIADPNGYSQLSIIDLLLEAVSLQESLPEEIRNQSLHLGLSESDPQQDPVLQLDTVARLYVSMCPSTGRLTKSRITEEECAFECGLPEFRAAFRLAELLVDLTPYHPGSGEDDVLELRDDLVLHIWCQALKQDDWSSVPEHEDATQVCSRSFLCTLVRDLSRTHDKALDVLFAPDKLFDRPELKVHSSDPQFRYLIQSSFEYLQSIAL